MVGFIFFSHQVIKVSYGFSVQILRSPLKEQNEIEYDEESGSIDMEWLRNVDPKIGKLLFHEHSEFGSGCNTIKIFVVHVKATKKKVKKSNVRVAELVYEEMLHANVQKEMEKEFEMALQDRIIEETKVMIVQKSSRNSQNRTRSNTRFSKNAQNPDQRIFAVQVNRPKAKIASLRTHSATSSFFIYKGIFDLKSTRAKVANL
nr:heat shock protein 70 family [Tanacetum cinerariifolium]